MVYRSREPEALSSSSKCCQTEIEKLNKIIRLQILRKCLHLSSKDNSKISVSPHPKYCFSEIFYRSTNDLQLVTSNKNASNTRIAECP